MAAAASGNCHYCHALTILCERRHMLGSAGDSGGDESSKLEGEAKKWSYIRVPGLGFLPGLVCPHHDR
jgi:hypothetical protein